MQAKRVSRQVRRLQGGVYEAVRKRVERGLSESREKNNDFFRIPIRFKIRNSPQFVTIRRKDSDKPLPPIKRPRALRQPGPRLNLHVSPRGEAKRVRGPSGLGASRAEEKGASRLARAGVLEQYVEHGKQAQRSPGARIRVLRPSGGETCRLVSPLRPDGRARRPVAAFLRAVGRHGAAIARHARGEWGVSQCPRIVGRTRSALRRAPFAVRCEIPQKWTKSRISERKHEAQRSPRFPSPLGRVRAAWRGYRAACAGGEWGVSQCPRAFRCGERQMNPC